jgi:hypothetical protein
VNIDIDKQHAIIRDEFSIDFNFNNTCSPTEEEEELDDDVSVFDNIDDEDDDGVDNDDDNDELMVSVS